jgi:hypothetical protein
VSETLFCDEAVDVKKVQDPVAKEEEGRVSRSVPPE